MIEFFGEEYLSYVRQTGRLFPRILGRSKRKVRTQAMNK